MNWFHYFGRYGTYMYNGSHIRESTTRLTTSHIVHIDSFLAKYLKQQRDSLEVR